MLIRKLFKFENAHIVRNCTSDRCKRSIHGHSYKVELLLKASKLDHGQMVYDFGLLKGVIKELFDSFDHAICFWQQDDAEYMQACKNFSARWVSLPVSPSAEQFSRIFFYLAQQVLGLEFTQVQFTEQIEQWGLILQHFLARRVEGGQGANFQCDRVLDTVVFAAIFFI